jgi:hypothetical protein
VLIGDHLPELGSDLVTALASLDVNDLSHFIFGGEMLIREYYERVWRESSKRELQELQE